MKLEVIFRVKQRLKTQTTVALLPCVVIGSWKSNVIDSEDGEWQLGHFDLVCK